MDLQDDVKLTTSKMQIDTPYQLVLLKVKLKILSFAMFTRFFCEWQGEIVVLIIICYRCSETNSYKLYPWIHQFSNNKRSADQIQPVYFPDVDPHSLPPDANFSMTAGDFQEIYSECSK